MWAGPGSRGASRHVDRVLRSPDIGSSTTSRRGMRVLCSVGPAQAASRSSPVSVMPPAAARLSSRARELSAVLELFPAVQHAFAYGSGIFVQPGLYERDSKRQRPMLDFMLAVDSPEEWHDENIARNRSHYSSLSWLGGRAVTCNAERLGAGVHFNTKISWGPEVIKYGVIRKELLCQDLLEWNSLYVAGRLQKPVLTLSESPTVAEAVRRNQTSALIASLLLLPKSFILEDVIRMIVGLSYLGDIRMGIAEDSQKIERIASGSSEGLADIYLPLLQDEAFSRKAGIQQLDEGRWQRDAGDAASCHLIESLPQTVRLRMAEGLGISSEVGVQNPKQLAEAAISSGRQQELLQTSIASIVGPSSRSQALAGLLMVGVTRSTLYVWEKLKKKWS